MQTAKQTLTVIFFVFNFWSLTELVVSLFLLNVYQPTQYSCSYTHKYNHLYSRNRNRGSISSWRRLFNRNENLRLSLTRYLAIASLRERLKHFGPSSRIQCQVKSARQWHPLPYSATWTQHNQQRKRYYLSEVSNVKGRHLWRGIIRWLKRKHTASCRKVDNRQQK